MDLKQFIIFVGSAVAIALVVLANRLITNARSAHIEGREAALARFRLDFPGFACGAALIGADLKAALLAPKRPDEGHIGLVRVMGDKLITRMLRSDDIAGARLEVGAANVDGHGDGPALELRLNDLSLPHVKIPLGDDRDPQEADDWLMRLQRLAPRTNMTEPSHGN